MGIPFCSWSEQLSAHSSSIDKAVIYGSAPAFVLPVLSTFGVGLNHKPSAGSSWQLLSTNHDSYRMNCSTKGLCKNKTWHLKWRERDRIMNTTHNPAQKSLHPTFSSQHGVSEFLGCVLMCWPCRTAQQAAKQHSPACKQTLRFQFGVTAHSGFHRNFLNLWEWYRTCWGCTRASRFPQTRCGSMNKFGPQELSSGNWLLQGSNMSMAVKPKQW